MSDLLLVAATPFEIAPTLARLEQEAKPIDQGFEWNDWRIRVLIAGVGLTATAFALGREARLGQYDLAIQAGIGGAIDRKLQLGQVVRVESERFADLGAEDADGYLLDLAELGFLPDQPYERDGRLLPLPYPKVDLSHLSTVHSISVNQVHGSADRIARLCRQYPDAQLESMEGAAFFYACRLLNQPCLQLRAISNFVEPRNRDNWKVGPAIMELNKVIEGILF